MTGITLALDAMGGDNAPAIVVEGARLSLARNPGTRFILYGTENTVRPLLDTHPALAAACELRAAEAVVTNDMKPSAALRLAKTSSMGRAIDCVRQGEAAGVISAGNTGALMALAKLHLGMLPGIKRPAIASFFPTRTSECIMLDLGANVECDADNLVQFARMGHIFAQTILGWDNPSLGLLNVGAEGQRGREEIREAAAILVRDFPKLNYHGFVEGNDITAGTVDVIVTDGFTGNIALKTAEGTAKLVSDFTKQAFNNSLMAKIGYLFAANAMKKLKQRVDPRRYNGAVFLGLPQVVIKSHGGTDALGFAAAIDVAVEMVANHCLQSLREHFAAPQALEAPAVSS
jgi:glycerol-3-phosphate acyltransferase PlsX